MAPTLRDGEWVLVESAVELREGDILALRDTRDIRVLHRLIRREGDRLITRGDGLSKDDHPWPPSAVIGRAVAVREGRHWCILPRWESSLGHTILRVRPALLRTILLRSARFFARSIGSRVKYRGQRSHMNATNSPMPWTGQFLQQQLGDQLAVFDTRNGSVHMLNETAAIVWRECLRGTTLDKIIEQIQREYPDVALDRLTDDVVNNVRNLHQQELVPHRSPLTQGNMAHAADNDQHL